MPQFKHADRKQKGWIPSLSYFCSIQTHNKLHDTYSHWGNLLYYAYCCCCLVTKPCPTLCDPLDCNTPGLPIPHHRLEVTQVHAHWISDAVWPSHPLLPSSPPAFNLSQHQGFSSESACHIREPKCWSFSFSIWLNANFTWKHPHRYTQK